MKPTAQRPPRPLIYGHRGCRGLRPENTLPAFLHALDFTVDGLELDVVLSADGHVVVSHEPWLNSAICSGPDGAPLTPEAGQAFNIFQQPYATIRRCNCGHPHPNFPEQQPEPAYKPTLQEVFRAVSRRCVELRRPLPAFSIELKSTPGYDGIYQPLPPQFVAQVALDIASAQLPLEAADILIMSFDHRVVQAARSATAYPVCLLIEDALPLQQHIRQLGFLPDVLGPDYHLLDGEMLRFCAEAQLPIVTWTVNDAAVMQRVAAQGVQGITTDYPDRAQAVLCS